MKTSFFTTFVNALVALLFLVSALAAFSGFPRFDIIQLSLASAVASSFGFLWIVSVFRKTDETFRVSAIAPLAMLALLLIWIFALGESTSSYGSFSDSFARWSMPFFLLLWAGRDQKHAPTNGVIAGLSLALLASAFFSVTDALQINLLPAIPTTIPDPTGFSGPFDDPQLAAAFGILGIFALFPLLRQKVHKFFRPLAMLGILSGGIIVGLAEQIGISLLLSSAAIILFFVTYKNENKEIQSSARLALVIALITPLLAFFGPKPPSIDSPINQTFGIAQMVNGEEPILTGENLPFYHETVANFALDGIPFGFGPDSYYAISEKYVDFNDAFARSNANNIPFGHRASRPILQLTGELGLFGLFLVLALFAFLLKNTFSTQNARSEKQIALFVAFSLFWIAPGLFGAAAMSALAAIFYGVTFDHSENTIPLVEEKTSVELSKNTEKTSNSELIPLKNWKGKYLFSTLV